MQFLVYKSFKRMSIHKKSKSCAYEKQYKIINSILFLPKRINTLEYLTINLSYC